VAAKFAVLPGSRDPGPLALGGAVPAIGASSKHQRTELAFIRFLTSLASERKALGVGSLAPVWSRLHEPAADQAFPLFASSQEARS